MNSSTKKPTFKQAINSLLSYLKVIKVVGLIFNKQTNTFYYNNHTYTPYDLCLYIMENCDKIEVFEKDYNNDEIYKRPIDDYDTEPFNYYKSLFIS